MIPTINDVIIIYGVTGEMMVTSFDPNTDQFTLTSLDPQHPFIALYDRTWFTGNTNLWWYTANTNNHPLQMPTPSSYYTIPVVGDEITFTHGTGTHKVISFDSSTDEFTVEDVSSVVKWSFKITLDWFKQNQGLWAVAKPLPTMTGLAAWLPPITVDELDEMVAALNGTYKNISGIGEDKATCTKHNFKLYQGIYESFEYCTICDAKRNKS